MLVKFNSPRILGFKENLIIPGINDLDENLVADMMADEIIAGKFDSGELEVLDKDDLGVTKKGKLNGVDIFLAASEKNAKNLASETVDLKILEAWAAKEKRPVIAKAIRAQIAKIQNIKYREDDKKSKLEKAPKDEE